MKPIKPDEIKDIQDSKIPSEVIEIFNFLIANNFDGNRAIVKQDEAADLIAKKFKMSTSQVYQNKWCNVENIYSKDWDVFYHKGPYYSEIRPYFSFSKKQRG